MSKSDDEDIMGIETDSMTDTGDANYNLLQSSQESDTDSDNSFHEFEQPYDPHNIETWSPEFDLEQFNKGITKLPLYFNSPISTLEAIAMRFSTFTKHSSLSKSAMSDILHTEKHTLPQPNNLPASYKEAKKLLQPFLLPLRQYDVCPNHCVVFRNGSEEKLYGDITACPVCSEQRYYSSSRSNRPRRSIKYIPVGPRFSRMFGDESLAAVLQVEASHCSDPDEMADIQDSPRWKQLFAATPLSDTITSRDCIAVGLEADGVAPYHAYNMTYSFTVVQMPVFNIIRSKRNLFRNIFLVSGRLDKKHQNARQ